MAEYIATTRILSTLSWITVEEQVNLMFFPVKKSSRIHMLQNDLIAEHQWDNVQNKSFMTLYIIK
jgi:hypothetical protein